MSEPISVDEVDYKNPPFPLTAIDREILATKDDDYHRITWDDLRTIIANNTLEELKRLPSDLRRYLAWSHNIKKQYGGITNYVVKERLHWIPTSASGPPLFEHVSESPFGVRSDYAVLLNDWPYGFVPGIAHIVVWSKTPIQTDDTRGDVTLESRKSIEDFVDRFFAKELGEDGSNRVLWFKNWVSLQSVRGVDHVHVLVRDAPQSLLEKWMERKDLMVGSVQAQ